MTPKKVEVEIEFVPNMKKVDRAMKKYKSSELGTGGASGGAKSGGVGDLAKTGVIAGLAGGIGGAIGATLGSTLLDGILGGFKGVMKVLEGIGKVLSLMVMPFANLLIPLLMPFLQLMLPVAKMLNLMLKPVMEDVANAMKLSKEKGGSPKDILLAGTSAMVRGLADVMGQIFMKMLEAPQEEKDLSPTAIMEEGLSTGNPVNDFFTELGMQIATDFAESEGLDIDGILGEWGLEKDLIDLGGEIGTFLTDVWDKTTSYLTSIGTWFGEKAVEVPSEMFSTIWVSTLDFINGISSNLSNLLTGIETWFENLDISLVLENLSDAITNLINGITNWVKGIFGEGEKLDIIGGLEKFVGFDIPFLDKGGTIDKTGVAVVHKGETVTPAGESGGDINIGITVNGGLNQETINRVLKELELRLQSNARSSGGFVT